MSFDLAVWHSESAVEKQEALQIYQKLCDEWPYLEGASSDVDAFYVALTKQWPEIDSIAEERVDDVDYCPWSCALNRSGMAVVMSCVWSKADVVAKRVAELAEENSLILFDPQTGSVYLPKYLRATKKSMLQRLFGRT